MVAAPPTITTMAEIPFVAPLDNVVYGRVEQVSPMIRRVTANNPNKFTSTGTGTYIVGRGNVAVIDPGPELAAHREALEAALRGDIVRAILVTHCHSDHSPLSRWLSATTGAPTIAFGPHGEVDAEDLSHEADDAQPTDSQPKETVDVEFVPDIAVVDGETAAEFDDVVLRAVYTPGHASNHTCFAFAEERALFTGDHVMGWSTTVVSPPDGDMRAYMDSLRKVAGRHDAILWPTHGNPVTKVAPFLDAYLDHRLQREEEILRLVRQGVGDIPGLVAILYADVRAELHKAAGRSVLSHLLKLVADELVHAEEPSEHPTVTSTFTA